MLPKFAVLNGMIALSSEELALRTLCRLMGAAKTTTVSDEDIMDVAAAATFRRPTSSSSATVLARSSVMAKVRA